MKMAHRRVLPVHHHFKQMDKLILQINSIEHIESFCEIGLAISPYIRPFLMEQNKMETETYSSQSAN
jgi:hypothetical protein